MFLEVHVALKTDSQHSPLGQERTRVASVNRRLTKLILREQISGERQWGGHGYPEKFMPNLWLRSLHYSVATAGTVQDGLEAQGCWLSLARAEEWTSVATKAANSTIDYV